MEELTDINPMYIILCPHYLMLYKSTQCVLTQTVTVFSNKTISTFQIENLIPTLNPLQLNVQLECRPTWPKQHLLQVFR